MASREQLREVTPRASALHRFAASIGKPPMCRSVPAPRRRLGSVEAAIGGRCVARVDPGAHPALLRPALRSRVRRSGGFERSRVKDTAVRFSRLTRRRSAATAASATAAARRAAAAASATAAARRAATATSATAARRIFRAVLGRQRVGVEAVRSWGRSSCPRHRHVAGRYPERPHRRGERTDNPSSSDPRRSHRPTDEQHGACPRAPRRNLCIFTPRRGLNDRGRRTLAQGAGSSGARRRSWRHAAQSSEQHAPHHSMQRCLRDDVYKYAAGALRSARALPRAPI